MAQIDYIRHLYETEGKSLREIAKIVGKNFRTVQKYAYMNDFTPKVEPNVNKESYPVLGKHIPAINEWLELDMSEPRKQRHTAKKIHDRLLKEKGYKGSYSSVKRYVVKKRFLLTKAREGYLPLDASPGHAQVDFGEFKYYDFIGIAHKGHALIVSFPYSNAGWMQVFKSENQECLLTGLKRIFYHIGGVCVRLKCDNMTTAVAQVLKGTERIITDGFYRFMLYHRFEADFCNVASGNEKGNVENKVGYERRNMLVPVPVIDDFEKFNEELLCRCDKDHDRLHYKHQILINELWEEERLKLLALPEHEYEVFRYESLRVDKNGFVSIDTNKYGLSPEFSGQIVQAKIYFDMVQLYYDHQLLKAYARSYKYKEEISDWKQYLSTLVKKPGATPHLRFFNQIPKLWQKHLLTTKGKERKTALLLLLEMVKDGNEDKCDEALELALEGGRTDADSIRQCYYLIAKKEHHPKPLCLSSQAPLLNYQPDLSAYDLLTGGCAR